MSRRSPEGLKEVIRDYRRDQIIDVARRLFGDRGTTEISMDEIATEAGVARSTLYVYFSSRDELLRSCLKRMFLLLQEELAGVWEEDAQPADRLGAVVRGVLKVVDQSPAFFRLAIATQASADRAGLAVGAELATIGLDMAQILEGLVRDAVAQGQFRQVSPLRASALIGQQLFGAISVRAGDPAPLPVDQEAEEICDLLLRGLAT